MNRRNILSQAALVLILPFCFTGCAGIKSVTENAKVLLPKSIDPRQIPRDLPKGTRVYVTRYDIVMFSSGGAPETHNFISPVVLAPGHGDMLIKDGAGATWHVPSDAKLVNRRAMLVHFIKPGQNTSSSLQGKQPEYIVP